MKVCCHKCEVLSFLTQEKWKSTGEIDDVTHNNFYAYLPCLAQVF